MPSGVEARGVAGVKEAASPGAGAGDAGIAPGCHRPDGGIPWPGRGGSERSGRARTSSRPALRPGQHLQGRFERRSWVWRQNRGGDHPLGQRPHLDHQAAGQRSIRNPFWESSLRQVDRPWPSRAPGYTAAKARFGGAGGRRAPEDVAHRCGWCCADRRNNRAGSAPSRAPWAASTGGPLGSSSSCCRDPPAGMAGSSSSDHDREYALSAQGRPVRPTHQTNIQNPLAFLQGAGPSPGVPVLQQARLHALVCHGSRHHRSTRPFRHASTPSPSARSGRPSLLPSLQCGPWPDPELIQSSGA